MDKWPRQGALMLIGHLRDTYALALQYAKQLLNKHPGRDAVLLETDAHPDFKCVVPEPIEKGIIKIDQLRDLVMWSVGRPQIAAQKVAIICPAHAMNIQAANALLKTLEEPSEDTLIILVSDQPTLLPATVNSRCFKVRCAQEFVHTVPEGMQQDLEAMLQGKVDPSSMAERWVKQEAPKMYLSWILIILGTEARKRAQIGQVIQEKAWWVLYDYVMDAKRQLATCPATNVQLLLENVLFKYLGKQHVG